MFCIGSNVNLSFASDSSFVRDSELNTSLLLTTKQRLRSSLTFAFCTPRCLLLLPPQHLRNIDIPEQFRFAAR